MGTWTAYTLEETQRTQQVAGKHQVCGPMAIRKVVELCLPRFSVVSILQGDHLHFLSCNSLAFILFSRDAWDLSPMVSTCFHHLASVAFCHHSLLCCLLLLPCPHLLAIQGSPHHWQVPSELAFP